MNLSDRDSKVIWHPYTHLPSVANAEGGMQTSGKSIAITKAQGSYLYDENGKKYIDAGASWWTNIHGHSHPYLAEKVSEQLKKLEHVIFAGFTHEPAVTLAERLLKILPQDQKRIFYSDNGSTAVEVALKMAFQYWHNKGEQRTKVIAFKNAYHGDTFGAMSVSGRSAFTNAFEKLLFDVIFIEAPVPGNEEESLSQLKSQILNPESQISSFIFEPLIQGTAGMVIHDPKTLEKMISLCKESGIITIADEVMTGFGRTGTMFACDQLSVKPDIFCLSKGITGGTMAFGVTSCTQKIYDAFLSDDKMKTFFHGHSYTANPIACSAANASLDLFEIENTLEKIKHISGKHKDFFLRVSASKDPRVNTIRHLGTILAIEIKTSDDSSYFNTIRDKAYNYFLEKGILMRPLGNVIYLMPPYCINDEDLDYIYDSITAFIKNK